MIYLITKAKKTYTFLTFFNTWGKNLRLKKQFLPFEKMVRQKSFSAGTYILTDYDILTKKQSELLLNIYDSLSQSPGSFKLLNHPKKSLGRIDLLEKLYQLGLNPFRCFLASNQPEDIHFPVFVRKGKDHYGKISDLIKTKEELNAAISKVKKEGFLEDNILITEFVDTSDKNGVFRKYSAFCINEKIIPRHIFFDKKWMIKGANLLTPALLNEEIEYVKTNPHKAQIVEIFKAANIQYGRIDYGISAGKIVTWEINPNPMIASSSSLKKSKRKKVHDIFTGHFNTNFKTLGNIKSDKLIDNPVLKNHSKKEVSGIFPFSPVFYVLSNLFQHTKSILLYHFYLIRNTFLG